MKTWINPQPALVTPEFAALIGGHPLLAATLARRGIIDPHAAQAFLDPAAYMPASPFDLPDMEKAVERIQRAIQEKERILIWGDFDVDGQTSTALLVSALRELGADVVYYIPNRHTEGHGVYIPKLGQLIDSGVRLVVTCDTGISAHEAVDYANTRGVDVIITDHHLLPPELPAAYAAVNPQRLPVGHPLRTLPGVGCAYKVVEGLYQIILGRGDSASRPYDLNDTTPNRPYDLNDTTPNRPYDLNDTTPNRPYDLNDTTPNRPYDLNDVVLSKYLDLVALGIVADVAEQIEDTRYLLQRGLALLRQTERLGLRVMIEQAGINPLQLNEGHIGFALGPRLNALGRLDDANVAVELLTTTDLETARILANRVEGLNNERRMESDHVLKAAIAQIERDPMLLNSSVLILSHEGWPGGIIGIVASRLVERYSRPVILLTTAPNEPLARGSARSISGIDITAALAQNQDMLTTFGGHTMAAGLSLPLERIADLRRALSRTIKALPGAADTTPTLRIDGYLPLSEITPQLIESLDRLAPFGPGNPPLILATEKITLKNQRTIGRTGDHLRLTVEDEDGDVASVLWWQAEPESIPKGRFDLAYTVRINDFQGKREVQLEWVDARPVDEEPLTFSQRASVEILDYRDVSDPAAALQILSQAEITNRMIWGEGKTPPNLEAKMRHQLRPAPTLVIWNTPPSAAEYRAALEIVNPAKVILFAFNPGTDAVQTFLQHFAGAIKFALNQRGGEVDLDELAAAVAHRPTTARAGLDWMAARGHIMIAQDKGHLITLADGTGKEEKDKLSATTARLAELLKETANYRAYFKRADKDSLIQFDR